MGGGRPGQIEAGTTADLQIYITEAVKMRYDLILGTLH